jgi:hypothetical protein
MYASCLHAVTSAVSRHAPAQVDRLRAEAGSAGTRTRSASPGGNAISTMSSSVVDSNSSALTALEL